MDLGATGVALAIGATDVVVGGMVGEIIGLVGRTAVDEGIGVVDETVVEPPSEWLVFLGQRFLFVFRNGFFFFAGANVASFILGVFFAEVNEDCWFSSSRDLIKETAGAGCDSFVAFWFKRAVVDCLCFGSGRLFKLVIEL